MIRPTLRQLDYLIAIEDEKSFSRAAESRNVTQSTLSAGIKDLENKLGGQLVNRTGRIITLTTLGNEIALKARDILNEVDILAAHAHQAQEPLSGALRLGVIPTIAPYLLPSILPKLQKEYPKLELQIHENISEHLIDHMHKRKIDVAIIAFPYDTSGLEHKNLITEDFYLAAPKNQKHKKHINIAELEANDLLLLEDGHCLTDHALQACKLQKPKTKKTFSATSLATLIQMVSHGHGVTLLPSMVAKNAPLPSNIEIIPFKNPKPTRRIGMIWPKSTPQKHHCQALFDTLNSYKL